MKKLKTLFVTCVLGQGIFAQTVVDVIVNSPDHNTLEAAVIAAELATALSDTNGTFTVFAPTDAAFNALPAGVVTNLLQNPTGKLAEILKYHVLGAEVVSGSLTDGQTATTLQGEDITVSITGNQVRINGALVTVADITTTNGVVHVIDAVILPPTYALNVFSVIQNSANHNTLETAINAAGLAATLSNTSANLTVFAPTDAAFAALPSSVLDNLLANPTTLLTQALTYHVLGAEVYSDDLTNGQVATTLQGETITISITGNEVRINNALVTVADIVTLNGVVHVIDAVLVPSTLTSTSEARASQKDYIVIQEAQGVTIQPAFNIERLKVYDITGKAILEDFNISNFTLSKETVNEGVYLVEIKINDSLYVEKVSVF